MLDIISFLIVSLLLLSTTILTILASVIGVFILLDMIKDYKLKWVCSEKEGEEE